MNAESPVSIAAPQDSVTPPRNKREWMALVGLVLVAATFSVLAPGILLAVPFALLALALPPRRSLVQITGVLLLALILSAKGSDSMWYFERGWTLLLGSWFVVFVLLMPRSGFVGRALSALAASAATAAVFLTVNRGAFARLDGEITRRLTDTAKATVASLTELFKDKNPEAIPAMSANMYKVAELQVLVFPAMLAIASLAALGAAWWVFRRLAASDQQPLRPLREFRFSDHLVWLLIAGAALMLVQTGALAQRTGSNLVLFMVALYALRGLAVFVVIGGAPGPFGMLVGAVLFVFLYPLVMTATILVGVIDTWLDIRAKRPIASRPGS